MLVLAYAAGERASMRKRVDIVKLLQWCYRDELPKKEIGGLTGWESDILLLGTRIDSTPSGDPGFPVGCGAPHPDALLIDWRVRSLPDVTMLWELMAPDIMGDLLPFAPADDPVLRRMQFSPSTLIQLHARMGSQPQWHMGPVKVRPMFGGNNRPVVRGITAGHRYAEGAHCPLVLELDLGGMQKELTGDGIAREIACARAEWYIWHSALMTLASEMPKLEDYLPLPPSLPSRPWLTGPPRKPRILNDISNRKDRLSMSA